MSSMSDSLLLNWECIQYVFALLSGGLGLQASLLGPSLSRVLSSDATPLTVFVP